MDFRYFWKWNAFEDYLLFCFAFTVLCAVVTLLLMDSAVFVEMLGSLAVMFEAMLGLPQLLQNLHNRSTKGMRYGMLFPLTLMSWELIIITIIMSLAVPISIHHLGCLNLLLIF